MTNAQAHAYAVIALNRLIGSGFIKGDKKQLCRYLDSEMKDVFDMFTEEEAEAKAFRILEGR